MKNTLYTSILGLLLAATAAAGDLPDYYPADELRRAGQIDAVYFEENRVVIDDVPYLVADNVIVHSPSSYTVAKSRLRPGTRVAFKVGGNRAITTFWILPRNYDDGRRP